MSDLIQIKRSDTTATPPSLAAGELAYSENSGNFFYGRISDGTPVKVGGNTDVLKLSLIADGAQVNTVDSVNGATGVVDLALGDLSNMAVDFTSQLGLNDIGALQNVDETGASVDQFLKYNGSGWVASAVPGGVSTFVALDDTPANYTGSAGYIVKVNAGGDALEYSPSIDAGTF